MKQTLLCKIMVLAMIAVIGLSVEVYSQNTTPNPVVKRNSPFSPNPKKKNETVVATADTTAEKAIKIETAVSDNQTNLPAEEKVSVENTTEENTQIAKSSANRTRKIAEESEKVLAPTETYKIGVGDVLDIRILNANTKESSLFTIRDEGLDYPLAGNEPIQVVGLTAEQVEKVLRENIKLYENPEVIVKIRDYQSHTIDVIGLVEKPGKKALRREAIPLYAIKVDAIVQAKANRLVLRRGTQVEKYDLADQNTENLLIQAGDILEFSVSEIPNNIVVTEQFYYTNGKGFISGGEKTFRQGITLLQAITASGGLKKDNTKKIIVRRKNDAGLLNTIEVDLKAIKDGQTPDFIIQAGDIIEVGN